MKNGYSILLGEYIDAKRAGYEDCAHFQIVCPECREPTFKCSRKHGDDDIHYFSHYGAKLPEQKECELRVGGYEHSKMEQHNSTSKKQRLSFFMKVLKSTLSTYPIYIGGDGGDLAHLKMNKSEGVLGLYEIIKEAAHHPQNVNMIDSMIADVENDFEKVGFALNTTFAKHIQTRITKDMWKTIITVPEEPNFLYLFKHAFLSEMSHWAPWLGKPFSQDQTYALDILSGFTDLHGCRRKRRVDKIIMSLASRQIPNNDGSTSTILDRILGKILGQMAEALLVMPYAEILNNKFGLSNLSYPEGAVPKDTEARKGREIEIATQKEGYSLEHPVKTVKH